MDKEIDQGSYGSLGASLAHSLIETGYLIKEIKMENTKPKKLLRLKQVLERIPVSKSTWWAGVKDGRFPKGIRMGGRSTFWKESDIDNLIAKIESGEE